MYIIVFENALQEGEAIMGFVPKGIYPAMLTPLTKDQSIDISALKQLTNHLIDAHVHGLFALGSNGEFHMFNIEDKLKVAEVIIQETAGRVPVMVGSGGNSTEEAIWLSKEMERLGADALSVITPFFIPPTQDEAAAHYKTIAASVSLPVLLYNIPSKTGFHLEPETVAELAKVDNIVGIKDSSGKFENIQPSRRKMRTLPFLQAPIRSYWKRFKREEREQSQQQQICSRIS